MTADALLVAGLVMVAAGTTFWIAGLLDPVVYEWDALDVWFQGDLPRNVRDMTTRWSGHGRASVHPLFPLIAYPLTVLTKKLLQVDALTAVRVALSMMAAVWAGLLFVLLRILGLRPFDTALVTLLALSSAAGLCWLTVPETYLLGSLSILVALLVALLPTSSRPSVPGYIALNVLTLGFTVTNWMAGLAATWAHLGTRRTVRVAILGLGLVALLSVTAKTFLFPTLEAFIALHPHDVAGDSKYLFPWDEQRFLHVCSAFLSHSLVMPAIQTTHVENWRLNAVWPQMSLQPSWPGSGTVVGPLAVALWGFLLAGGLWALFSLRHRKEFRLVLGLTLLGQFTLHLVYGEESFLYSLHYLPLLVILVSLVLLTRIRPVGLVMVGCLLPLTVYNNSIQMRAALMFFEQQAPDRHRVELERGRRPRDDWPRGEGHVLLAQPASDHSEKGYHEVGAGFSPGPRTFGVSLWIQDAHGEVVASSGTIAPSWVDQRFEGTVDSAPGIATWTPYYRARWSSEGRGRWRLRTSKLTGPDGSVTVVIRSVGPAGGPVTSLVRIPNGVVVNDRWRVTVTPAPSSIVIGDERSPGWRDRSWAGERWSDPAGWGYARFVSDSASALEVTIEEQEADGPAASMKPPASPLQVSIPDVRFSDTLSSQLAHLLMGASSDEVRAADPLTEPLSSHVDTAHVVVALARAGYLDQARALAAPLASQDFLGRWGPQADMPGLAIWALSEVAALVPDPEYRQAIWPHVERKAAVILAMLETRRPLSGPIADLLVSKAEVMRSLFLLCRPADHGLIQGRVEEGKWPKLHVNATAYLGLVRAATMARSMNRAREAATWSARAHQLRTAWERAFRNGSDSDMFYVSSLWPSEVATGVTSRVQQYLEERWARDHDGSGRLREPPRWPESYVSEAHQWLRLSEPRRVWMVVEDMWQHQASPGLYTWARAIDPEHSMDEWASVRSTFKSAAATPHYRTAAELVLLQLEMLALRRSTDEGGTIVLGAGLPESWLQEPFAIRGVPIPEGRLDWSWDGRDVHARIVGRPVTIRLSPVFPPHAQLTVEYE